jgi:hypothetical protein
LKVDLSQRDLIALHIGQLALANLEMTHELKAIQESKDPGPELKVVNDN